MKQTHLLKPRRGRAAAPLRGNGHGGADEPRAAIGAPLPPPDAGGGVSREVEQGLDVVAREELRERGDYGVILACPTTNSWTHTINALRSFS